MLTAAAELEWASVPSERSAPVEDGADVHVWYFLGHPCRSMLIPGPCVYYFIDTGQCFNLESTTMEPIEEGRAGLPPPSLPDPPDPPVREVGKKHWFASKVTLDEEKRQYVLKNALNDVKIHGWKFCSSLAGLYRPDVAKAKANNDWEGAAKAKVARDGWQLVADHERDLMEKCDWAVKHSSEKLVYHRNHEDFDKCKNYQSVVDTTSKKYLDRVPQSDKKVDLTGAKKPYC